ncbi:MAG: exo-alpha-sialidase [Ruminococcus sp.]|nr:exo-alpha-sialidase [Ruminococcus sp.]
MKKIILAMAITAVFAGAMAGCGQVGQNSPAVTITEKTSAEQEESKAEETTAPETDTETTAETSAPEESKAEETTADSSKADKTTTTTTTAATTQPAENAVSDTVVDYQVQHAKGLANTASDGRMYCLVPSDGGAGHRYYYTYFSSDSGATWTEGDTYDEINGDNTHIAMDNGDILLFTNHTPRGETYPRVYRLTPSGNAVSSVQLADIFEGVYLPDGRAINSEIDVNCTVTYLGGTQFSISFNDNNSGDYIGDVEIDISSAL